VVTCCFCGFFGDNIEQKFGRVKYLGILKKNKNTDSKRYMQPNVHGSIIYSCHGSNLCPSTDEQIKEM